LDDAALGVPTLVLIGMVWSRQAIPGIIYKINLSLKPTASASGMRYYSRRGDGEAEAVTVKEIAIPMP